MSTFFVKVAEIDGEREPASRVLTGPELRALRELLAYATGSTENEVRALVMLRELVGEALAKV